MAENQNSILHKQLHRVRKRTRAAGGHLVREAQRILNNDLFSEEKILKHLGHYNALSKVLEENDVQAERVFSRDEIRQIAIAWRLKFLNSAAYKPGIPFEAVLTIKDLNRCFSKDLQEFFVLSTPLAFNDMRCRDEALLFTPTSDGNYYLVHRWGQALPASRRWTRWPMRGFENLFGTVLLFTLCVTLALPTGLITLDDAAAYWSGYRAAAFFHLLIFNTGVTAYFTFAFAKNFSSSVWNRDSDF